YPEAMMTVAADNDQWTEGNPGLKAARAAAEAIGGILIYPTFTKQALARFKDKHGKGPTDFNDLHQTGGIAQVKEQVNNHKNSNVFNPYKTILDQSVTSITSVNSKASRGNNPSLYPSLS